MQGTERSTGRSGIGAEAARSATRASRGYSTAPLAAAALGMVAVGAGVAVSAWLTDYPVLPAQAARYGLAAVLLGAVGRWGRSRGVFGTARSGDGAGGPGDGPGEATGRTRGRARRAAPLGLRGWGCIVLVAGAGMALFNVAVVRAVTTGEPAAVATIIGCAPVLFALGVPAMERRRPAARVVGGACLVALGAAAVEGFGHADAASLAWSAVALVCEVVFTVAAAPVLRTISALELSLRACTVAAVLLAVASVALDGTAALQLPGGEELAAIAYLAVVATVVAFVLWYEAVRLAGAETVGLLSGLMPVAAAVTGVAVTAVPLRWLALAGTLLVAAGLTVALRQPGRSTMHARPD